MLLADQKIPNSPTSLNTPGKSVDVAINIYAKPFQTALSLLSLYEQSGQHINEFWLQFEPAGSKYDNITAYHITDYLKEELGLKCNIRQPQFWLAREAPTKEKLADSVFRRSIRYQSAFEESEAPFLFLMHNDIYVYKDIIGALKNNIEDAFAIGSLGQCWNCPAANAEVMSEVMNCPPCSPERYEITRPNFSQLGEIYHKAREKDIFARPYDKENFSEEFERQPWPLPECRINEWACLINLQMTRPFCIPFGEAWPPGAFRLCSGHNLDLIGPFFRDMHSLGMRAKHLQVENYLKHWIGTGKKSRLKYTQAEDNARRLLERHYPRYISWLKNHLGQNLPPL